MAMVLHSSRVALSASEAKQRAILAAVRSGGSGSSRATSCGKTDLPEILILLPGMLCLGCAFFSVDVLSSLGIVQRGVGLVEIRFVLTGMLEGVARLATIRL